MFWTPKEGQKMKISKIPTPLFFLNHTKMTFQWISTKIEDLHKHFDEILNCNFFAKMVNFIPKS